MEDWALRAMRRWPNVPALFGWLGLTRRGRWLIRGETISRPQIIDTINANYAADEHGRWFFQNGPQRGYIQLESAPLILWTAAGGDSMVTHTGLRVERASTVFLDEEGSLLLATEHGPGLVADSELDWATQRLECGGKSIDEAELAAAPTPFGSSDEAIAQCRAIATAGDSARRRRGPCAARLCTTPRTKSGRTSVVGHRGRVVRLTRPEGG